MDMVEFGHHASDQTNPIQTPDGVIKISDKEARDRSTTRLRLSALSFNASFHHLYTDIQ